MTRLAALGAALLALSALGGCIQETGGGSGSATPPGNEPEAAARAACLRDVAKTTGNGDVSVVSSSFSQAGTEVIVKVGPSGTWRCIAAHLPQIHSIDAVTLG